METRLNVWACSVALTEWIRMAVIRKSTSRMTHTIDIVVWSKDGGKLVNKKKTITQAENCQRIETKSRNIELYYIAVKCIEFSSANKSTKPQAHLTHLMGNIFCRSFFIYIRRKYISHRGTSTARDRCVVRFSHCLGKHIFIHTRNATHITWLHVVWMFELGCILQFVLFVCITHTHTEQTLIHSLTHSHVILEFTTIYQSLFGCVAGKFQTR